MSKPPSLIGDASAEKLRGLARQTPAGHAIVEVGVFKGGSAWYLADVARERGDQLHLFDTFSGIPIRNPIDEHNIGDFSNTSVDDVLAAIPDAILHVGIFPATIPADFPFISFIHCDCDQYESVKAVIDELWPLVVVGGIICFDDMNTRGGEKAIRAAFPDIGMEHGWYMVRKQ